VIAKSVLDPRSRTLSRWVQSREPFDRLAADFDEDRLVGDAGLVSPGRLVVRAGSGFYNHKVIAACSTAGVEYSVTTKIQAAARRDRQDP
jgi:saccharopine dehydrogenase-like NADP-dependent oxidoreductase